MILQNESIDSPDTQIPRQQCLVRYGLIPQVARFELPASANDDEDLPCELERGTEVVVESERGLEIGTYLQSISESLPSPESTGKILRIANAADLEEKSANIRQASDEFAQWIDRIDEWQLQLQLIDLEYTLVAKNLIVYVLNDRNAETTRMAILAAAAGLGIIHVQPVTADGIVPPENSGCGSCGCGS